LIGILAAIHYLWLSKLEALLWPLAYSAALALLLTWRVQQRRRKAIPVPEKQTAKPLKFFKQKPD
jgi:sulfoxide reductase heme-binding subunit YedZ